MMAEKNAKTRSERLLSVIALNGISCLIIRETCNLSLFSLLSLHMKKLYTQTTSMQFPSSQACFFIPWCEVRRQDDDEGRSGGWGINTRRFSVEKTMERQTVCLEQQPRSGKRREGHDTRWTPGIFVSYREVWQRKSLLHHKTQHKVMHILSLKGRCLSSSSVWGEKKAWFKEHSTAVIGILEREEKYTKENRELSLSLSLLSKSSLTPEFTHPSVSVREKDAWREVEFAVPGKSYGIDDRMTTEVLVSFSLDKRRDIFFSHHTQRWWWRRNWVQTMKMKVSPEGNFWASSEEREKKQEMQTKIDRLEGREQEMK